jgi:hypothetical protein
MFVVGRVYLIFLSPSLWVRHLTVGCRDDQSRRRGTCQRSTGINENLMSLFWRFPTNREPPRLTAGHVLPLQFYILPPANMSSRISIARPQTNSFNADPHGLSNSRASTGYRSANPDDPLEILRSWSKQVEDNAEIITQPLRPHLPAIGRFLIVVTFLEDALRIMTQWSDQIWYLQQCVLFLSVQLCLP